MIITTKYSGEWFATSLQARTRVVGGRAFPRSMQPLGLTQGSEAGQAEWLRSIACGWQRLDGAVDAQKWKMLCV